MLRAQVQFLTEMLIIEVTSPALLRRRNPDRTRWESNFPVQLLRSGAPYVVSRFRRTGCHDAPQGSAVASVQEVAQQIHEARDKTDQCAAAVRQAGELTHDAVRLLHGACYGAVALEGRAVQVIEQWTEAVHDTEQLARRLADLDARLQALLDR